MAFKKIKNWLLDLIFPYHCLGCQQLLENRPYPLCSQCEEELKPFVGWVCPVCFKKLDPLKLKPCPACQKKTKLKALYASQSYQNPIIQKLIQNFKYKNIRSLAQPLARLIMNGLEPEIKNFKNKESLTFIPIPLAQKRYKERGYNQAELLAKEISHYFQINFLPDALYRIKYQTPQVKVKNYQARKENIRGAFKVVRPEKIKGKTIFLVDDVYTTGATLNEAAKVLKESGAKEVFGIVVARD